MITRTSAWIAPATAFVALGACGDGSDDIDTSAPADASDTISTSDSTSTTDASTTTDATDASTAGDADVLSDGDTFECCPIAPFPECGCFDLGGSPDQPGGCSSVCDAPPVGWERTTDENGCPEWTGGGAGSCLIDPDADAGPSDDVEVVDDADAGPDGDVSQPDETDPVFGYAGSIRMVEQYSDGLGAVSGTYVLVTFADRPPIPHLGLAAVDGDCRVYASTNRLCEGCDAGQVCDPAGICQTPPKALSAGDIGFDGLVEELTAKPSGGLYYTVTPDPPNDDLFKPGAAIDVAAAGDAGFAAFDAAVHGVGDVHVSGVGAVELVDGKPFDVEWTPSGDADAQVEITLQLGWHGQPPTGIIFCRAPDSAGKVTITPAVIAPFPYFGGVGLFQVPSYMDRVSRHDVSGPYGPIEVVAASRAMLFVTHSEE